MPVSFPQAYLFDSLAVDMHQQSLSNKWLTPDLDNIVAGIARIRARIDQQFSRYKHAHPQKNSAHLAGLTDIHTYPYGYCEPIRNIVWNSLQHSLQKPQAGRGHFLAVREFINAGGLYQKIWGELTHGPYLQNAIQMGIYYIDAANDTVIESNPKLDVRLLADTNFKNINSLEQYFDVVQHYYQWDTYPNTVFPQLAPLYPGIAVHRQSGVLLICDIPLPLMYKNLSQQGALSRQFLERSAYSSKIMPASKQTLLDTFQQAQWPRFLKQKKSTLPPWLQGGTHLNNAPHLSSTAEIEQAFSALQHWLDGGMTIDQCMSVIMTLDKDRIQLDRALRQYSYTQSGKSSG